MNRKMSSLFPNSATRNADNQTEYKESINNDANNNKNVNVDKYKPAVKQKANAVILDLLTESNNKKVVGFHLDQDIREALKKVLGKNPPRGMQSKLANKIFRDFFKERD
ncbi:hypothetical protein ACUOAQ_32935, partial [Escherichia sp. SP-MK]